MISWKSVASKYDHVAALYHAYTIKYICSRWLCTIYHVSFVAHISYVSGCSAILYRIALCIFHNIMLNPASVWRVGITGLCRSHPRSRRFNIIGSDTFARALVMVYPFEAPRAQPMVVGQKSFACVSPPPMNFVYVTCNCATDVYVVVALIVRTSVVRGSLSCMWQTRESGYKVVSNTRARVTSDDSVGTVALCMFV